MSSKVRPKSKSFGTIIAVVGVIGAAAIGYVVSRPAKVITLSPADATVAAAGIVVGSPDALVEVIEFADFECPACAYFATLHEPDIMSRLVASGEIRFRFMDFPVQESHPNSVAAHSAAQCANEQGKFWEMHDGIFMNQDRWNTSATRDPRKPLQQIARDAGLDVSSWNDCYDSERMLPVIAANRREGERLRVNATPSFIIGGQLIPGGITYDMMRQYVTAEKIRVMAAQSAATGKAVTAPTAKTP